jgi:guanosine-3',5'-bis(diphosphate) 3'-pyrophosphohydrolase
MPDQTELLLEAVSFAARAHRHQLRKDKETPYVSHVFRVCLVVRHVFGVDDPQVLAAALLHDTIEDTTTDYDDVLERFGPDVANWTAALTKDMRLVEAEREEAYREHLTAAPWQVAACKLADIYDNMTDSKNLTAEGRARQVRRSREYLNAMRGKVPAEVATAFEITEAKVNAVAAAG